MMMRCNKNKAGFQNVNNCFFWGFFFDFNECALGPCLMKPLVWYNDKCTVYYCYLRELNKCVEKYFFFGFTCTYLQETFWIQKCRTETNSTLSSNAVVKGYSTVSFLSDATDFLNDKATEKLSRLYLAFLPDWNEFFCIINCKHCHSHRRLSLDWHQRRTVDRQ